MPARLNAQAAAGGVSGLLGHQPVHGQLAAGDGEQARRVRVLEQLVAAREPILDRPPFVERGADAGGRPHGAQVLDGRKDAGHRLQQVVHLVRRDFDVIEVAEEVVVGGAQHRDRAVRDDQDVAAVDGLGRDHEVADPAVVD